MDSADTAPPPDPAPGPQQQKKPPTEHSAQLPAPPPLPSGPPLGFPFLPGFPMPLVYPPHGGFSPASPGFFLDVASPLPFNALGLRRDLSSDSTRPASPSLYLTPFSDSVISPMPIHFGLPTGSLPQIPSLQTSATSGFSAAASTSSASDSSSSGTGSSSQGSGDSFGLPNGRMKPEDILLETPPPLKMFGSENPSPAPQSSSQVHKPRVVPISQRTGGSKLLAQLAMKNAHRQLTDQKPLVTRLSFTEDSSAVSSTNAVLNSSNFDLSSVPENPFGTSPTPFFSVQLSEDKDKLIHPGSSSAFMMTSSPPVMAGSSISPSPVKNLGSDGAFQSYVPGMNASSSTASISSVVATESPDGKGKRMVPKEQDRIYAQVACYPCFKAKIRCGNERPCRNCVKRGKAELCVDRMHKQRGRPKKRKWEEDASGPSFQPVSKSFKEDSLSSELPNPGSDNGSS